jgi:hypothetical protein
MEKASTRARKPPVRLFSERFRLTVKDDGVESWASGTWKGPADETRKSGTGRDARRYSEPPSFTGKSA